MTEYKLTVQLNDGDHEDANIHAKSEAEAAFLLGAQFGLTAGLRDPMFALVSKILPEEEVVDGFVKSVQENFESVTVKAV